MLCSITKGEKEDSFYIFDYFLSHTSFRSTHLCLCTSLLCTSHTAAIPYFITVSCYSVLEVFWEYAPTLWNQLQHSFSPPPPKKTHHNNNPGLVKLKLKQKGGQKKQQSSFCQPSVEWSQKTWVSLIVTHLSSGRDGSQIMRDLLFLSSFNYQESQREFSPKQHLSLKERGYGRDVLYHHHLQTGSPNAGLCDQTKTKQNMSKLILKA